MKVFRFVFYDFRRFIFSSNYEKSNCWKSVFPHLFVKLLWSVCATDLMNSEIIHFPRSHRSPPVRSFHLAYALCTGWIDFTLFGFDNHVYCAMKCGVAEGWQYPSTRGNLLTAGARWRYSLAQERSAHSDTTASVCAMGSLAVIYDASRAITLSLTLIQQFIYCHACIRAEVSFLWGGGCNQLVPHP